MQEQLNWRDWNENVKISWRKFEQAIPAFDKKIPFIPLNILRWYDDTRPKDINGTI